MTVKHRSINDLYRKLRFSNEYLNSKQQSTTQMTNTKKVYTRNVKLSQQNFAF